jgi:hypothetical protein
MDKTEAFDMMYDFIKSLAAGKSGDIQITMEAEDILDQIAGRKIIIDNPDEF